MNDPVESNKRAEAGSSPVPCSAFLRVVSEDRPHWFHLISGPKSVSKVELKIDNQSFLLDYEANSASDAEWMAYQLGLALRKAGVSVRGCGLYLDPAQCTVCGGPLDNEAWHELHERLKRAINSRFRFDMQNTEIADA